MKKDNAFAEIIESSLQGWLAQSWQWNTFPTFGSILKVQSNTRTMYGIVHQIQTGSMDPVRYPFAYQKTEEELLAEQPQIFEFLKTSFSCLILGYQEKGHIYYQVTPEPPKIHSFVYPLDKENLKQFFINEQYLHMLFNSANQMINIDELLLALLKNLSELNILTQTHIEAMIENFNLHTGNDYRRLKLFLQRAQPLLEVDNQNIF